MELLISLNSWTLHKVENLINQLPACLQLCHNIVLTINLLETLNRQLQQNTKLLWGHFDFHLGLLNEVKDTLDDVGAPAMNLVNINELNKSDGAHHLIKFVGTQNNHFKISF
jgi:hypothetical protein